MKRHYYIIKGIVLLAAMLLAACSSSDSDDSPIATSQNEIHLTTNVTSMPSGTRATTIDNNTELQKILDLYLKQGLDNMRITTVSETQWKII